MGQMGNKELIARRVAEYFKNGDVVNLGIGIPLMSANYMDSGVLIHTENGLIGCGNVIPENEYAGNTQLEYFINAGSQPIGKRPGYYVFDSATSFAIVRSGKLAGTVLGALEVAENGDIANYARPGHIVGMGGAMDLCTAKKVIVATEHCTKKGEPKLIHKCTLPLTAEGAVTDIVTERAVFEIHNGKMYLTELMEGYTVEDILNATEASFMVSDNLKVRQVG